MQMKEAMRDTNRPHTEAGRDATVQVLFAFLLVVPFDSGFSGIGPFERS